METLQEYHTTSKDMFELPQVLQIHILWFCDDALLFTDCAYYDFRKSNFPKFQWVTVTQHNQYVSSFWAVDKFATTRQWAFGVFFLRLSPFPSPQKICDLLYCVLKQSSAAAREELMRDAMRRLRDQTQKSQQMFEQKLPEIINNKHCQEVPVLSSFSWPIPSILANHCLRWTLEEWAFKEF